MEKFPHKDKTVALFLNKKERNLMSFALSYSNCSLVDANALEKTMTKEDLSQIKYAIEKLHKKNFYSEEPYLVDFNKQELWLIKHIVFFVCKSIEEYIFSQLEECSKEDAQQLLMRINLILSHWEDLKEKESIISPYPLLIEEQVTLGKHYVYAFFERSPSNLDFIIDVLDLERLLKIFYLFKTKEVAGRQYPLTLRSYEMLLERCEVEKEEVFVLHFLPYKNQCHYNGVELYIYPEAIVVAIYKQPWDVFDPTLIELSHSLFEKAHRVMTGFKKMEAIKNIQPEPSLNELIKSGQRLPTLERQLPSTDFEVKNFNPKDEKHSNALKMLQCITKELLSF